jgi:uncharacterized membrane protein YfcA
VGFISQLDPIHGLSGAIVGLLIGMTGVGGGSLMTPLLILIFGMAPATAVGTDLLYGSATKLCGTAVHSHGRRIDWKISALLASGSLPATAATVWVMADFGLEKQKSGLFSSVLGVALLFTSLSIVFRPAILRYTQRHHKPIAPLLRGLLTVLIGLVLGTVVTLSSVGAGALGVTALLLLYPELPPTRLVGTDIAHAVPLTLVAGLGHWYLGSVDWMLLASLLTGSIPGVVLGSHLSAKMPETWLRLILAAVLVIAGIRLI